MKKLLRIGVMLLVCCLLLTMAAGAQQTKLIALTFDDGPSPEYTPQVLSILERKHVDATFFLIGRWLRNNDGMLKREVEDGDQIANHTWGHVRLTGLSDGEIRESVSDTAAALTKMTGLTENFVVRPPMGARNSRVLADISAPVILWSVDAAAGKQVPAKELVRRTLAKASDGGIILMHDSTQANVDAVEGIIDGLHSRGYELVTVRELFRLKGVALKNGVLYQRAENGNPQSYPESRLSQHWAYSDIRAVSDADYMKGDVSGWHPNRYLSRGQAITILWRMSGSPRPEQSASFPDVPAGSYYARAAAWARENGISQGDAGKFRPNSLVTREQLYALVCRLAELQGETKPRTDTPVSYGDDARIDSWAADSVNAIRRMGFASKNDVEIFRPRDWATRAETAELIHWYSGLAAS